MFGARFLTSFWLLVGQLFGQFWGPILDQIGPRWAKMGPRGPSIASKHPKTCNCKNLEKPGVFQCFWGPMPSKTAWEGPRRLPRGTKSAPTPSKKGSKNGHQKISLVLRILGPFWGQKVLQNWTKHGTTFGTLSLRISGVGTTPKRKINERCRKGKAAGLVFRKRKGGIRPLRAA